MAWTNSKIIANFVKDALDRTVAYDLDTDSFKAALFNNTTTPDNAAAAASTGYNTGVWVLANEVDDGTEWDAGGEPLVNEDVTRSTTTVTFDADNTSSGGSSATLSNVYGAAVLDDTITTPVADPIVCYNYLGGANSVVNGTFTVQWGASGIFTLALA